MAEAIQYKKHRLSETKYPNDLGLEYIEVQRLDIDGEKRLDTAEKEHGLVVIRGSAEVLIGDDRYPLSFRDMMYVPRNTEMCIEGSDAVLMRYACPAENTYVPRVFPFSEVDDDPNRHIVVGAEETSSRRQVWKVIDANFDCDRLMMGLCEGSNGGWAAWPPHEHAEEKEEVYVYYDMGINFGVQLVYEKVEDPIGVFLVEDGDLVSIAQGYHPNVGCPGGKINFIYCMAAKKITERSFDEMHFHQRFL